MAQGARWPLRSRQEVGVFASLRVFGGILKDDLMMGMLTCYRIRFHMDLEGNLALRLLRARPAASCLCSRDMKGVSTRRSGGECRDH